MTKKYRTNIIYYILALASILIVSSIYGNAESISHPNMFINTNEIEDIKEKVRTGQQPWKTAYNDLMVDANSTLSADMQSVTFGGPMPPSGDIHDEYTDSDRTDYSAAINVGKYVRSLGLAYALTGDSKYADKALKFIRVWTIDPDTRMNPKFTTFGSQIELSITMPGMFYGADLIWNYPGWNNVEKEAFKQWTIEMIASAKTWSAQQNFENWRLVFISSASVIAEDANSRQYAFDKWKEIIPDQMDTDGKMMRELDRETSLSYSLYAINAMIQTADIAKHYEVDLYNYKLSDGRGLEKTLDFHAPYVVNPSTWPYQQTTIYRGANAALYELAYTFKQKSSYFSVINKWKRPMYEIRVLGPVTLTHANAYLNLTEPGPNISPTGPRPTPRSGTTPYGRLRAIISCYVRRIDGTIDNCY